jgi:hypothetical protein
VRVKHKDARRRYQVSDFAFLDVSRLDVIDGIFGTAAGNFRMRRIPKNQSGIQFIELLCEMPGSWLL